MSGIAVNHKVFKASVFENAKLFINPFAKTRDKMNKGGCIQK